VNKTGAQLAKCILLHAYSCTTASSQLRHAQEQTKTSYSLGLFSKVAK